MKSKLPALIVLLASSCAVAGVDFDIFALSAPQGASPQLIYHIDDVNGNVLGSVALPAGFQAWRFSNGTEGSVIASSQFGNQVLKLNPLTGEVLSSYAFTSPYAAATNGQYVYLGTFATTPKVVHKLAMDFTTVDDGSFPIATPENGFPIDMEFAPSGELVVSATKLRKYDPDTGVESAFRLSRSGTEPNAGFFTLHNGSYYVRNSGEIDRYDANGAYQARFASGFSSLGGSLGAGPIQFGPNGNCYISEWLDSIIELDGSTGAIIRKIPISPGDFVFAPVPEPGGPWLVVIALFLWRLGIGTIRTGVDLRPSVGYKGG